MKFTREERAVLAAIPAAEPPYTDTVRRRANLTQAEFDVASRELVRTHILMRCSAPTGELLYPTLRGAEFIGQAAA